MIGWDLAWMPDGPVLIEGNTDPDTHYLQRVHRQTLGRSPMAPYLRHHFAQDAAMLKEIEPAAQISAAPPSAS